MFVRAASFAAEKHKDQRRKNVSAEPYINHPLAVARVLVECGVTDETVLCGAVLHDTVEDTGTLIDEIEREFGPIVSGFVVEVTDDKSLPKVVRKREQIIHALNASPGAKLIKLADKFDNLAELIQDPPQNWTPEYIRGYFVWSYVVVRNCRGSNLKLERKLDNIFKASNAIPESEEELNALLDQYYSLL